MMTPTLLLLVSPVAAAPPQEDGWLDWWTENLRWSIDESVRVIVDGKDGASPTLAFFGLDIHNVISTESRDVATLTLQPYLTRVDGLDPHPPLFDGPDDWELVWRIFNANVKLAQDGSANLRVGHMELPFGIEHVVNTNGTLRDYIHADNFGVKADWGASLNGELEALEYEVAWTRGSGNQYRDEGDNGVISGRLGTPRDAEQVFGVSFLDGEFLSPAGTIERERLGVDALVYHQDLGFFAELSAGEDAGTTDVVRALGEVNWRNRHETVLAWAQLIASDTDGPLGDGRGLDSNVGVRWTPAAGWSLSCQWSQVIDPVTSGGDRHGTLGIQLRYRF